MITFPRRTPPIASILAVLVLLAFAQPIFAKDKAAKIDELMKRAHAAGRFNGTVLVAENGKVIYKKGFGLANMEWNISNEPETKFRLGSITKQFTAALILQLVEQGKIKLDAKIIDYLSDYRKDIGSRVTISHLLAHTSGIPSYTSQPGFFQDVSRDPYTVEEFVKKYASSDLEFEPGSKWSYNNSGYFLLGAIIEKVTGKAYEQVLKEKILDPLGMKNTGYDHHDTIISRRAAGYIKTPDGYRNAPYLDMSLPYAAGSLYSTIEDLYLWDQALYTDRVLSAASREVMFKPVMNDYAYGWAVAKVSLGPGKEPAPSVAHGGGINGFNTKIVRFVRDKNLIVLLDNTSQGRSVDALSKALTSILYDLPYELPKKSVAEALAATINRQGAAAAITQYRELKARPEGAGYDFDESELNTLGYQLIAQKRILEAIEIFKLNVEAYPQAFNTYDSLGEAYMVHGERELAIKKYRKSLELNPQNENARRMLAKLGEGGGSAAAAATAPNGNVTDRQTLDDYVGEYEMIELGRLSIMREGDKLWGEPHGDTKVELTPQDKDQFAATAVGAQVSFFRDEKGRVTQLIIRMSSGREVRGTRVK